jgi:hypothetical protein
MISIVTTPATTRSGGVGRRRPRRRSSAADIRNGRGHATPACTWRPLPVGAGRHRVARRAATLLALVQAVDAVLCYRPVGFVAACLDDVAFPRTWWPVLTPVKTAAALGLLGGRRSAEVGALTASALAAYFAIAVGAHMRARDLGRNALSATVLECCSAATALLFWRVLASERRIRPVRWTR